MVRHFSECGLENIQPIILEKVRSKQSLSCNKGGFSKRKDRTTKASKSSIRHHLQPNTTKHSQTTKKITHNP